MINPVKFKISFSGKMYKIFNADELFSTKQIHIKISKPVEKKKRQTNLNKLFRVKERKGTYDQLSAVVTEGENQDGR